MRPIERTWVAAVVALLCVVPLAASDAGSADRRCRTSEGDIRKAIRSIHDAQKNVGLAVHVLSRGKPALEEYLGFADLEHRVPVAADTSFGLASITKAFTGAALLKLVEAGRIDLDAPIQNYVPDFPVKPGGEITVRLLAAHLSGIRHWKNERTPELYAMHFDGPAAAVKLIRDEPLEAPPGTKFIYSSYNYNILGAAIERASGMPYTRFVETTVLAPLGLAQTGFDDVRRVLPHRARRYSFYDLKTFEVLSEPIRVPEWDYSHNMAGGNMVTTAGELARFGRAFVRPGLLEEQSWKMLLTRPRIGSVESLMSFGWYPSAPDATRRFLHGGGSNAGLQASLDVYPDDDLVVVVLSNTWGIDSRSGDLVSAMPRHVARLCFGDAAH